MCVFSLRARGPAGYAAEQQLGGRQPGMRCRVDAGLRHSRKKSGTQRSSRQSVLGATEGNEIYAKRCINILSPLVSLRAESISSISLNVLSLAANFMVYTSNPQKVWDALSQKLAARELLLTISVRCALRTLAGSAFASLIVRTPRSVNVQSSKNIDYPGARRRWVICRGNSTLAHGLISPISGISVERAWMLDKVGAVIGAYATRVLETLSKAAMSSRLCARDHQSLRRQVALLLSALLNTFAETSEQSEAAQS